MPEMSPRSPRLLTSLMAVALTLLALEWAQAVLVPIALAVFLSFILTPAVLWLQRQGLTKTRAILLTSGGTIAALLIVLSVISIQLRGRLEKLPENKDKVTAKVRAVTGTEPGVFGRLVEMIDEISADLSPAVDDSAMPVRVESGPGLFPAFAGSAAQFLGSVGLVVALTVTMLFQREDMRNRIVRLAGYGRMSVTTKAFDEATTRITRYLSIQALINAVFGTAFAVGLWLLGVPFSLLCGFLAAILRFVPYIGTWLAGSVPVLLGVAVFDDWGRPGAVLAFVVICGVAANNVIEPLYISRRTGVSPLALVVSAAFWTWLWGPIGLVLATPITVCLAVLGRHVQALRPLEVMLGTGQALDPQYSFYQRLLARDEAEADELLEQYLEGHDWPGLADAVLAPTFVQAKRDLDRHNLTDEDMSYLLAAARSLLAELPAEDEPGGGDGPAAPPSGESERPELVVLGCPANDEADRLLREVLGRLVESEGVRVVAAGPREVAAELAARVRREPPAAVCLAALPPGGLRRLRFLCKRLKATAPDLPVIGVLWGEDEGPNRQALLKAGADVVVGSLREGKDRLLESLGRAGRAEPEPEPAGLTAEA